jgi:hypothetical protein
VPAATVTRLDSRPESHGSSAQHPLYAV